jgi:abortive infection bacteriophage resistance protein
VLDAIERIEVSARTKLIHHFANAHGPFGHLDDRNLPRLEIGEYLKWRANLVEETRRSKETFKKHFFEIYGDHHKELPVWMLAELMSMGATLTFFKGPFSQQYGARWFVRLSSVLFVAEHPPAHPTTSSVPARAASSLHRCLKPA